MAAESMQVPLSGELLVVCPLCKAQVRLEPSTMRVHVSFFAEVEGQVLRTEAAFAGFHQCEHIHHFVPTPTGERVGGVPTFVLICTCGTHQGEEAP